MRVGRRTELPLRIAATAVSTPIAVFGHTADRLLALCGLAPRRLSLPPRVLEDLQELFGDSLPFSNITIREGTVPGIRHGRAFALPRLVYLAGGQGLAAVGDTGDDPRVLATPLLVHELVHVWQARHRGWRYIAEALYSQLRYGRRAYDWSWWLAPHGGRLESWADLPVEAQAQFVADAYAVGRLGPLDAATSLRHAVGFDGPVVSRVLAESAIALRTTRR